MKIEKKGWWRLFAGNGREDRMQTCPKKIEKEWRREREEEEEARRCTETEA